MGKLRIDSGFGTDVRAVSIMDISFCSPPLFRKLTKRKEMFEDEIPIPMKIDFWVLQIGKNSNGRISDRR